MFEDPPMTPEQHKAELEDVRHEPLLAQLRDDIRTEVARDLPNFSDQEKEFADIDSQDILSIYKNWRYRQIHPHARTIVYSAELSQRIRTDDALYVPVKSEFKELTRMIAAGEDLLSRNLLSSRIVRKPYELTPNYSKLKRQEHLDLLLNEQGIHHLHLPGLERKRGTPILFAIFEPAMPSCLISQATTTIRLIALPGYPMGTGQSGSFERSQRTLYRRPGKQS
jgi:hypothetical protein